MTNAAGARIRITEVAVPVALTDPSVRALLEFAIGPGVERRDRLAGELGDEGLVLNAITDDKIVGVIAIARRALDNEILAIAVATQSRRCGIATMLIEAIQMESGVELRAETDAEAVGFYAALGFSVKSIGEVHPGVERFICRR